MENIVDWVKALDGVPKIFFWCGFIGSAFLMIQSLLTMVFDIGDDLDSDLDSSNFTIKNMTIFMAVFGWCGLGMIQNGSSYMISTVTAVSSGVLAVFCSIRLMMFMGKMEHNGTADLNEAISKTGVVYLAIPANSTGIIRVSIGGRMQEYKARTNDPDGYATGEYVSIVGVNDNVFEVTRWNNSINN